MDTYDWKIIDLLEKNANLTHQEIGDLIGLSVSQCCRRKKHWKMQALLKVMLPKSIRKHWV